MDWFLYDNDLRHERVNGKKALMIFIHIYCCRNWIWKTDYIRLSRRFFYLFTQSLNDTFETVIEMLFSDLELKLFRFPLSLLFFYDKFHLKRAVLLISKTFYYQQLNLGLD